MNEPTSQPNNMNLPQPITTTDATNQGAIPIAPVPVSAPQQLAAPAQQQAHTGAADRDIIEPAWVHAVERTLRQSIDDPRKLAVELSTLKARYIKERYGKEIKSPPNGQV